MKMCFPLIPLIYLIFMVSCKKDDFTIAAQKLVAEWMEKTITIPNDIVPMYMGTDTIIEAKQTPYKILVYTDSTGCVSCKLKLSTWKYFIHEIDSIMPGSVEFQFYFQPKNSKEMTYLLKQNDFTHPVFIDQSGKINKINKFPSKMEYQCFLLDNQNKVLSIGNPTLNQKIWDLYKQIITKNKDDKKSSETTVEIEQQEIEVENLKTAKMSNVVFILKNTGSRSLVIRHVDASCGCTVPHWDAQPVKPDEKTEIHEGIKPDNPGIFNKTIYVYTNADENVIPLHIRGKAD